MLDIGELKNACLGFRPEVSASRGREMEFGRSELCPRGFPAPVQTFLRPKGTHEVTTHRLLSSSVLGLPFRILYINHKKGTT